MTMDPVRVVLKNDQSVGIRPICPADESALVELHKGLSDRTVYQRYFHMMGLGFRTGHERLARICAIDGSREVVLVMEHLSPERPAAIIGVARLTPLTGTTIAEFAVLITDAWQGCGAGTALMRALAAEASSRGITRIQADILTANVEMRCLCQRLGMTIAPAEDPGVVRADLAL